jgi:hypothetical protein
MPLCQLVPWGESKLMLDSRPPLVHYHDSCMEYHRDHSIWVLRMCTPRRRYPTPHLGQVSLPTSTRSCTNQKVQPLHDPIPNRSIFRGLPIPINFTPAIHPLPRSYYILPKPSFARTSIPPQLIEEFFDPD